MAEADARINRGRERNRMKKGRKETSIGREPPEPHQQRSSGGAAASSCGGVEGAEAVISVPWEAAVCCSPADPGPRVNVGLVVMDVVLTDGR